MSSQVFACPLCQGQFAVPHVSGVIDVVCPHCQRTVRVQLAPVATPASPEASVFKIETDRAPQDVVAGQLSRVSETAADESSMLRAPDAFDDPGAESRVQPESVNDQTIAAQQAILKLLPPTFEVFDPARRRMRSGDLHQVLLPQADGGTTLFDDRILRITHQGKTVTLIASSPAERRRLRWITNLVTIVIAILILAIAYWLLM